MDVSSQLADIAACIGNPPRAAMLWSLVAGESRPASELAMVANISPQTASNHLKILIDAGLLEVSASGRNKFYRLKGAPIATALESLLAVAQQTPTAGIAERIAPELVFARTCYDHLAGELAVAILRRFLERGLLRDGPDRFALTERGRAFFEDLGIDVSGLQKQRRRFAYACLDWSHRVPHLGGSLGAGLLDWLLDSRILVRSKVRRAVRVTDRGQETLERLLALRLTRERYSLAVHP
jgi:DNA-binding transcriptional ArsR family regulator